MYIAYIVYYGICLPSVPHTVYFDAAKFSIKLFSFIYFTVSVVRQQNEYEIVTETDPLRQGRSYHFRSEGDRNICKTLKYTISVIYCI